MTKWRLTDFGAGAVAYRAVRAVAGHVVLFDRMRGGDWIDADCRWVLMHLPSTLNVAIKTKRDALALMRQVGEAPTVEDAARHAEILPEDKAQ